MHRHRSCESGALRASRGALRPAGQRCELAATPPQPAEPRRRADAPFASPRAGPGSQERARTCFDRSGPRSAPVRAGTSPVSRNAQAWTTRCVTCRVQCLDMERLDITLDNEQSAKLTQLAQRIACRPGYSPRSLLANALDEADPTHTDVVELLNGIPGAHERARLGLRAGQRRRDVPWTSCSPWHASSWPRQPSRTWTPHSHAHAAGRHEGSRGQIAAAIAALPAHRTRAGRPLEGLSLRPRTMALATPSSTCSWSPRTASSS